MPYQTCLNTERALWPKDVHKRSECKHFADMAQAMNRAWEPGIKLPVFLFSANKVLTESSWLVSVHVRNI